MENTIAAGLLLCNVLLLAFLPKNSKMILTRIAFFCAAYTAMTVAAGSVASAEGSGLVLRTGPLNVAGDKTGIILPATDVHPGDVLTITGECVNTAGNFRVVLTLADVLAAQPGFRSVLPTDQEFRGDTLQVRVPDMPETADRVFDVKVFRLGNALPVICDAGSIRIGSSGEGKVG